MKAEGRSFLEVTLRRMISRMCLCRTLSFLNPDEKLDRLTFRRFLACITFIFTCDKLATNCSGIISAQNVVPEPEALASIWGFLEMCDPRPYPASTEKVCMHIKVWEALPNVTRTSEGTTELHDQWRNKNQNYRIIPLPLECLLTSLLVLCFQTLHISKQSIRNLEKEKLHAVNAEENSVLQERWLSDECINAVMSFLSRKAKLWSLF